ncbi:hypothetical protein [Curtobacterium sp. 9128]|uniref:hypothetical protein n=1 Tax=Curtobacterium sp. 9128 TaxID=1793722 RepID=UPI00119F68A5|nr:hypothetical protein [Curtobacterium sp. 9128]
MPDDPAGVVPDLPGPGSARSAQPMAVLLFGIAGISTLAAIALPLMPGVAHLLGLVGGLSTLAGLCFVAFGPEDDRPLRDARGARTLLLVAAVAAVLQTLLPFLGAGTGLRPTDLAVLAPSIGIVGGVCVCAAVVRLLLARRRPVRPELRSLALAGLTLIGVGATCANVLAVLASVTPDAAPLAAVRHVGFLVTGVGEVLVAADFWLRPIAAAAPVRAGSAVDASPHRPPAR